MPLDGELEDIVQKVAIEGAPEAGQTLMELAETAETAFGRIAAAAASASAMEMLAAAPLAIAAAVIGAGYAITKFTEIEDRHIVTEAALAESFGTTREGLSQLKTMFDGVSTEFLDRAITRTAQVVENSTAQINQNLRTAPIAAEAAAEGMVSAQLGVESAQNRAADVSTEWAQRLKSDALSVQEAYIKLQFTAQDLASQMMTDMNSITGAGIGVEQAELKLKEFNQGGKKDSSDLAEETRLQKESLELAVEQAKQRQSDAQLKQQKDIATAPLTAERAGLSVDQAQFKQHQDLEASFIDVQKASNDLARAFTGLKSAAEHAYEQPLHDVRAVADALRGQRKDINIDEVSPGMRREGLIHATQQDLGSTNGVNVYQELANITQSQKLTQQQVSVILQSIVGGRAGSADIGLMAQSFVNGNVDFSKLPKAGTASDTEKTENASAAHALGVMSENAEKSHIALEHLAVTANGTAEGFSSLLPKMASAIKEYFYPGGGAPDAKGHAEGGPISGPGTGTSDSIPARLSHGEWVHKAAAVRFWGSDFMHAINNMEMPGFAMGGPVVARVGSPKIGSGGSSSTVNLRIDGHEFNGLRAPQDVAASLTRYAISRQTAQVGRQPSWVK